ncbi:max-binding protein MNT-like isoform X1 [Syngnathus typhle]|uniref:max-binding protein MNT-like isoform X1 n=1 Tax=Syngnathus typhle TaxID=161592 RepID=UPI002A6AA9EB|nr:max-binding protein MNT-like isoform X1 [Syngnathus typhle]
MSIDTLLEAARYLEQAERDRTELVERQAEPRRLTQNEEQWKVTVLINQEAESRCLEPLPPQQVGADLVSRGEQPPCPAAPPPRPPQAPVAVIPVMPVVAATPAPLPLAATVPHGPPLANNSSQSPPRAPPHQLLCSPHVKMDGVNRLIKCSPLQQPQVHIRYPPPVCGDGSAVGPALVSHQAQPLSHLKTNGLTLDDMKGGANAKRRPGGAGTREVHNKLEQNRRAHLKECFETLKKNVPNVDDKKTSNLSVLRSALRYIQTLKRKEKEYEHEMERLAREKIATQQRLSELKKELSLRMDALEIERLIRQSIQPEDDQASTSTASEGEDNLEQDGEEAPAGVLAPILQAPMLAPHLSIQHTALLAMPPSSSAAPPPQGPPPPPTVIAHAAVPHVPVSSVSHPSVIQAVSHALPANHKHLPHIAPLPGPTPISHITVHPVARLGAPLPSRLPTLYPQGVSVSQPAMVGHITHTFAHHALPRVQPPPQAGANGGMASQQAAALAKPTAVLAPHPQLVGQAAVTMVTVPTFPVSTIKLA